MNPDGWRYLNGTPNQPSTHYTVNQHFKAGLFTVAGYWYTQSPDTINNCNNCYPTGTVPGLVRDAAGTVTQNNTMSGGMLNPNVAYVLPVNADSEGNPALDANGNPKVETDSNGNLVWENGKPKVAGAPIDLTVILEKYLAYLGTVDSTNTPTGRIDLVDNAGTSIISLPNFATTLGFKTMQPLCGTIGKTDASVGCPQ